jgi:hypothetical protein
LNRVEAEFLGVIRTKILRLFLQENLKKTYPPAVSEIHTKQSINEENSGHE